MVTRIVRAQSLQWCPTLCNRMNCSLPGSSVHGIFQARILEWVAMPSSRGSSRPRDPTRVFPGSPALQAGSPGKPIHQKSPLPTNCSANAGIFCWEGNANASKPCHPPTIASLPGPLLAPCLDWASAEMLLRFKSPLPKGSDGRNLPWNGSSSESLRSFRRLSGRATPRTPE